ncbi:MAG: P-loop NTPase, partial [Deltaproteobacteria bacterium]|nr:P-loop NTPase [Deltaproteobacteria bacterium]
VVSAGFIKKLEIDERHFVSFDVELTTPACPLKASFKQQCEEAVSALPWVEGVNVSMSSRAQSRSPLAEAAPGLADVAHVVAISSCKGGVGKSTLAVNLAYALSKAGAAVGLFDADVYGPSLPTLVDAKEHELRTAEGLIQPIEHEGVKLMSFGYATERNDQAAIMRGPMVSNVIRQLLTGTNWGRLDYLVIDMPPGTGDIQLTLTQIVPIDGAVIVTTPQRLSFVDVIKGIQMFQTVKVPTLAVVENMSYFECGKCGERHQLFGTGARERIVRMFGIDNAFEVPIDPEISRLGDAGRPVMLEQPESSSGEIYASIAGAVTREVSRLAHGEQSTAVLRFDEQERVLVLLRPDHDAARIDPAELRRRCQCAGCQDEMTGERILKDEDVPDDVVPVSIEPMGNYAAAIVWSDGHSSSIYPYDKIPR